MISNPLLGKIKATSSMLESLRFSDSVRQSSHGDSEEFRVVPFENDVEIVINDEGPPPDAPPLNLLTADEILTADWPEPVWAIPKLLPSGLTILAGKPKLGKSWLALQVAQAVAAGGVALGERVQAGPILYLALEDPPRRLRDRMTKQRWPRGLPADFLCLLW